MEGSTSDKQVSLSPNGYQDVKLDMDLHLNNHNNSGHHNHSPPKGLLSSGGSSGGSSSSTQMSHRSPSDSHSDEDDLTGDDNNLYPQYPSPTSNGYAGGVSSATGTCREAHSSCCKTTLAFLFLFYNMTLNLFILAIVHERVPLQIKEPLPDIAFDALPSADRALDVAEYIIVSQVTLVFILLFIHKHRAIIFRRLCIIMGVLYLFRGICMISTTLPRANQNYYCSPQLFNSSDPDGGQKISSGEYTLVIFSRVFHMLTGFGLSINGRHNYCGDYLYSGHTVILTITYLFLREYLMPTRCRTLSWKLFNLLLLTSSFTGILAILISRGHYLIDILLAYYVTTRVFWIYHTIAYNYALRVSSPTNYLSRVWWFFLLKYFESIHQSSKPQVIQSSGHSGRSPLHLCNCDAAIPMVPRYFEWPLPWPRWLRRRTNRYRQRLLPTPAA